MLVVAVVVATLVRVVSEPLRVVVELLLLVVLLAAGWFALTRTGARRVIAVVVAVAVVVALVAAVVGGERYRLGLVGSSGSSGSSSRSRSRDYALGATVGALDAERDPRHAGAGGHPRRAVHEPQVGRRQGRAVPPRGRVHAARDRPVVLEPGMDWLQTVRDVAASGVDVLGMAGGDGSQAMVGTVAAELGLPMVVVPAGTRNHLALDLGLDRDDVVGALDAYGEAVERTMDLADLNGHVFVNNVSLGLYAAIVRSPEYRDAKVDTTLATLPQVLGPDTEPFDLRFTGPDGVEHRGAHLIQISNNPYGTRREFEPPPPGHPPARRRRPGARQGTAAPAAFLAALATGHPERFEGLTSWATPTFEVTSDAPIDIGLDGETMVMDPPLRFSIRPSPVRVRLPKHAIGYSPAARALGWREAARQLWQVVLGHPARFDT